MSRKQKPTFTLIEMLIVVVIIGILAAALIPRLQSVQARARDTKRKADLHQIATALEIYKEDNGGYKDIATCLAYNRACSNDARSISQDGPDAAEWIDADGNQNGPNNLREGLSRYMTSVPLDTDQSIWLPNTGNPVKNYAFVAKTRKGQTQQAFAIMARTESDGQSSNWVMNISTNAPSTLMNLRNDNGEWHGGIYGNGADTSSSVSVYEEAICNSVTFTGGITDNLSGTCYANKDSSNQGGDIRYIYAQ